MQQLKIWPRLCNSQDTFRLNKYPATIPPHQAKRPTFAKNTSVKRSVPETSTVQSQGATNQVD